MVKDSSHDLGLITREIIRSFITSSKTRRAVGTIAYLDKLGKMRRILRRRNMGASKN